MINRRSLLRQFSAAALASALPLRTHAQEPPIFIPATETLRSIASKTGRQIGCATSLTFLERELDTAALIASEYNLMVPENEMKFAVLQPREGVFDFKKPDALVAFAKANGMGVRGHTLLWYKDERAPWLPETFPTAKAAEAAMYSHITNVVKHYRGTIGSWDVVNEGVLPRHEQAMQLRRSIWQEALGPHYIALAFQFAHAADPKPELVYNENELEYDMRETDAKRAALLNLIDWLQLQKTPLHAIGIQSHLRVGMKFNEAKTAAFVKELTSRNLKVLVTELDVNDVRIKGGYSERDRGTASHAQRYLETLFGAAPINTLAVWGPSDRRSWLNRDWFRPDGSLLRPLPFDRYLREKPLKAVIANILRQV